MDCTVTPKCLRQQLTSLLAEDMATVLDRECRALDRILAQTGGQLVLFGAGNLGRCSLECLLRDGIRPRAFCDNNPSLWGTEIAGVPVLSPDSATALFGGSAAFVVTIWGLAHRYAETHDWLTAAGCRHVYPAAPLRWKYSSQLLPFFFQDLPHKVYEEAGLVLSAFDLWADDRSRKEYLNQVRYRALGDLYDVSAPDPEPSYFLDNLYRLSDAEVFIDCGAYDGDTLRAVLERRGGGFTKIVALEPDPGSFHALQRYIGNLPARISSRISAYPYAVSSERRRVSFNAGGGVTAAISDTGNAVVDAVPLDELLSDLSPTFIKMDIEGAEIDALEGARQVIARDHPLLSICLYHRQRDLWRIPLLIHSIHPGYRFYMRAHETDGWQTVGYAVPPERLCPRS